MAYDPRSSRSPLPDPFKRSIFATCLVLLPLAAAGCSNSTGTDERHLRGSEIAMGQGTARTEVTLNRNGDPVSMSVVLSEGALSGLPATAPVGGIEYVVPLPAEAGGTRFDHVGINWGPTGHPPEGVYNVPHFDVHFYMISMQQRDAMTPAADPQFGAKANRQPAPEFVPPNYTCDPGAVPRMGSHCSNRTTGEHHGQAFTHTMIYGFFNGAMVFIEPMITKAFLETRPNVTEDFAIPSKYPQTGSYPTRYGVRYDANQREYRIELLSFASRPSRGDHGYRTKQRRAVIRKGEFA